MTKQSPVNAFKVGVSISCQARENGAGGVESTFFICILFRLPNSMILHCIVPKIYKILNGPCLLGMYGRNAADSLKFTLIYWGEAILYPVIMKPLKFLITVTLGLKKY